jgi:DNA-binding CsgD family transcriptional regulator
MRGQMARAIKLSGEAVALADDSPGRIGHDSPAYAPYGWILMELDQAAQSRTALDTGRRLCEQIGVRWPLATYQAYLAVERFHAGEWDDAVAELEAGIGCAEETGVTYALKPSHRAQAVIRLHRNDLPGAWQAVDNAAAVGDRRSRLFDYRALSARALLSEAEGDTAEAFTTLADRWRICQDAGMAIDYPVVGPDLARLARAVGDAGLAEEVTAAVEDVASGNRVPSITGAALRCRGLLDDDVEAMTQALDAYSNSPRRLELALTCEESAGLAARRGDIAGARSLLDRANGIFERLDAARDLVRVDAALRQLGVRRGRRGPRRRPQWGWGSLTPTERTIADLVAQGLTNPQIAGRLYISRRTVQTHVSHTFTKLGMASRAQLAAAVAAQSHAECQPS